MERRFRVLLVDDEKRILTFLLSKLKSLGYDVITASNGKEALKKIHTHEPELIVLDLVMPEMGGLDVLQELRSFSSVPVIILSAKGSDADKIKGLELGADDYLAKPFNPDELVARIEAVKRRLTPIEKLTPSEILTFGDLTIDFDSRRVMLGGQETKLTRIEWLLLSELTRNAGRLMPYDELLVRIWGPEYRSDVQILRTWISRLREKLERTSTSPRLIRTIPKTGYIFQPPSS